MPKIKVLNINYENVTLSQAVSDVIELSKAGKYSYVVTPNAEIAESCFSNPLLLEAVNGADYTVPDGAGVVLASKILGRPLLGKVAGIDLAAGLLPLIEKNGLRLYLLGGRPGVAEKAAENMKKTCPSLIIAGVHDGYFKDDSEVIPVINSLNVDVIYIGFSSPKQEIWMHKNKNIIKAGVMIGLGGTLDGFAGVVKRAPGIFIKMNLEWLYRLIKQPSRFVRMLRLPKYIIRAAAARVTGKRF